jgi:hypothetical protein
MCPVVTVILGVCNLVRLSYLFVVMSLSDQYIELPMQTSLSSHICQVTV